jgi:putative hydrolase of the HAD superfamily
VTAARGILFDLDDTLYRERRFALSGFAAVARAAAEEFGVGAESLFRPLARALRTGARAEAFQRLCSTCGWPEERAEHLLQIFRTHEPTLRLPRTTARTLAGLASEWRLAIVTNGPAAIQRRKVSALGLASMVDAVVYAAECGTGEGKPAPEPFAIAARKLGLPPSRCVFVGDHPVCDVFGARRAGMRTVRITQGVYRRAVLARHDEADAVVGALDEVPAIAASLLAEVDSVCA